MKRWADDIFNPVEHALITDRWRRLMADELVMRTSCDQPQRFRHAERITTPICDGDGRITGVFGMPLHDRQAEVEKPQAPANNEIITYL